MSILKYECFVRAAFGQFNDGKVVKLCDIWGEPAMLANQGLCDFVDNLHLVKSATAYSACIFKSRFPEELMTAEKETEWDAAIRNILSAESFNDIEECIDVVNALREQDDIE